MSLLQPSAMFNDHINSPFASAHMRSHSFHELLNQFKSSVANSSNPAYVKKRSHSDLVRDSPDHLDYSGTSKRSRTAPPSPPYDFGVLNHSSSSSDENSMKKKSSSDIRSKSLSPNKKFVNPLSPSTSPKANIKSTTSQINHHINNANKIKLPSLSTALNLPLKPITPTVSLDYFDTYKPNDENWRYELLDTINKDSKHFHLNQYNYLNKHATSSGMSSFSSSSSSSYKPNFDSRLSSKITKDVSSLPNVNQPHFERKINFPYESNYTYLNKTYLNDVAKYPEYLELAQSLIQLSQPQQQQPAQQPQQQSPIQHKHHEISPQQTPQQKYQPYSAVSPTGFHISTASIPPPPPPIIPGLMGANYYATKDSIPYTQPPPPLSHTVLTGPTSIPETTQHKFIPITPPSSTKSKSRSDLLKSPPKQHNHHNPRVCISCGSDQSPCWRPSWSIKEGQLCNSCGLRYKKTSARCLNSSCKKIPAKGEWSLMQSKGKVQFEDGIEGHSCLECGWRVEVKHGIN
ncbi:hypothetical protein DFJ63DRAFT_112 [Scheffersomyces coipomensis]|uniref:uncharacterized protein n=1 Tax=Scheffersomyces coipomensis TaxID=1788519 RepID=UPI00315DBE80